MRLHNIAIFVDKNSPITPNFNSMYTEPRDIYLILHSGTNSRQNPEIAIFFDSIQEATNFKNAIIQSWETLLREIKKEKS